MPFLGEVQQLRGALHDGNIVFKLPAIEKGAVLWLEGAARDPTAKKIRLHCHLDRCAPRGNEGIEIQ